MLIVFYCYDSPNGAHKKRIECLAEHLAWAEQNMNAIKVAGPILSTDGNGHCGSMYVLEADSVASATALLKTDPYCQAGIWQRIEINQYKAYAGDWVGGKNWPDQNTHLNKNNK